MIKDIPQNSPLVPRTKMMAHQEKEFWRSRDMHAYGAFWEMGAGKSKLMIDTASYLFLRGEIDGVIIIANKGSYRGWIDNEIPKHLSEYVPHRTAHWAAGMSRHEANEVEDMMVAMDDCLDFLCVNCEALTVDRAMDKIKQFIDSHYCLIIADESQWMKNWKAQRTVAAQYLAKKCDYRRILSGTPMTNNPLDLYSQVEFLRPGVLGFQRFFNYRAFICNLVTISMGSRCFQKVAGFKNLDVITERIAPFTSRILKSECMDLPDKIFVDVFVDWTPEQRRAYLELKSMALLEFEQGLVTSTSALTTVMRLHQINCGHVKLDDKTTIPVPSNRINTMLELIELMPDKVVIWGHFQEDVRMIMAALTEAYGPESMVDYYGPTSDAMRQVARQRFRDDPTCRFFVSSTAVGGMGINELVVANQVIYYSLDYNLMKWLQSQDRNHRPGQTRKVTYHVLQVKNTIDTKIIRALHAKHDLVEGVLNNLRDLLG